MKSGYVALIGYPNAGKSTLLNQILKEKISITAPRPQTTRNRIPGIYTTKDVQIIFVDTPGIIRVSDDFNRMLVETALAALGEVDVVCLIIDVLKARGEEAATVVDHVKRSSAPVVLVLNKIDLLQDKRGLLPVIDEYRGLLPLQAAVPISALTGDGVGDLLNELTRLLPEGPRYFPEDYLTDQPERFLVAELIREKVFHLLREEVPYAVAVTVDTFHEKPEVSRIDIEATIHVERDSQKRILIGKQGQMIREIGKQARRDIETLLGSHVFLGLFVRTKRNWRKDPRARLEFGYRLPG